MGQTLDHLENESLLSDAIHLTQDDLILYQHSYEIVLKMLNISEIKNLNLTVTL